MAWRLYESVVKGFIDNRDKGRVFGEIYVLDQPEPILLELRGNCHRDIAGCRVDFINPMPSPEEKNFNDFTMLQRGTVGDITASRKVKVFDVPLGEAMEMNRTGKEAPFHFANSIYLEWFSDSDGRCVAEMPDFKVTISEAQWTMSKEEEEIQCQENMDAFQDFLGVFEEQIEKGRERITEMPEQMDEYQWEEVFRHGDALTDRSLEVFEKSQDMGIDELALEQLFSENEKEQDLYDPEEPEYCRFDEFGESDSDLEDDEDFEYEREEHPFALKCREFSLELFFFDKECREKGDTSQDRIDCVQEMMITGAKAAGGLNSQLAGPGFVVAYLKRCHSHLQEALNFFMDADGKGGFGDKSMEFRNKFFDIRDELLDLISEYRDKIN